jgi:hypothetical protein
VLLTELISHRTPLHNRSTLQKPEGVCPPNVLGACNFSLEFEYMLAGWEGSAHDGQVLKDVVAHDFQIPQDV